jgi:hypothetical protein
MCCGGVVRKTWPIRLSARHWDNRKGYFTRKSSRGTMGTVGGCYFCNNTAHSFIPTHTVFILVEGVNLDNSSKESTDAIMKK